MDSPFAQKTPRVDTIMVPRQERSTRLAVHHSTGEDRSTPPALADEKQQARRELPETRELKQAPSTC